MFTLKRSMHALALFLSCPLFGAAGDSWFSSSLDVSRDFTTELLKEVTKTPARQALLATSLAVAGTSCLQSYRTSRPVPAPVVSEYDPHQAPHNYDGDEGVVTLFSHGLGGEGSNAAYFAPILPGRVFAFNYPDAPERSSSLAHTGIGQPVEVEQLKRALRLLGDREDVRKIFIFGISRGGATLVNLLKEADIPHIEKIEGVMVESSFAELDDIIRSILRQTGIDWIPGVRLVGHAIVKAMYNQYSMSNQPVQDLARATAVAKQLPIFMVQSQEDALIPASSSERLAQAMIDAGFQVESHTYPHGAHAGILWNRSAGAYRMHLIDFVQRTLNVGQPASSDESL